MKNNELHIGHLPDLAIVPVDKVLFHEYPDPDKYKRLAARISKEDVLKNPPMVLTDKDGEMILLDGANRTQALKELGVQHLFVQTVSYKDPLLSVSVWSHAVEEVDRRIFEDHISGLSLSDPEKKNGNKNDMIYQVTFPDGTQMKVPSHDSIKIDTQILHGITDLYIGKGLSDRVSYHDMSDLQSNYRNLSALITFKKLSIEDLVTAARNRNLIPSGISRVLVPKRALNFNFPLNLLRSSQSLEEKNSWLEYNLMERIRSKSIRFYREPTFIFDE